MVTQGAGRHLVGSAYPDDVGTADPQLRAAIAQGELALPALAAARLLVAVVAVADVIEDGADKESHMAVVSMVNAAGERGLLAFTGIDAMQRWQADARPVPVTGAQAAAAAIDDGASAMVIDVQGPVRMVIGGEALTELAGITGE
jgi:hypothetical protein